MKICKIWGRNFLAIGNDPVTIDLTKYGNIVNIRGRNGHGKCFGVNTPILMYNGEIKNVQDIKVGDLVMGDDSRPRKVLELCRGKEMLYEIIPSKGSSYVCNESHVLSLKCASKKNPTVAGHDKSGITNITVKEYIEKPNNFKRLSQQYRKGVSFKNRDVKIDPYFLGIWLGDGTKSETSVTNADSEVVEAIYNEAKNRKLKVIVYGKKNKLNKAKTYRIISEPSSFSFEKKIVFDICQGRKITSEITKECSKAICRNISKSVVYHYKRKAKEKIKNEPNFKFSETINHNTLLDDLKYYNLINNKHIPLDYLANSRETRLQVLAGLIDTDGSLVSGAGYDISQKNNQVAEGIVYLARSLGLAAYSSKCKKKDQNGVEGVYNRISISGDCSIIPVRIPYKKASKRKQVKDVLNVSFQVKPLGVGDYYGFTINGNNLFLLGDFTVVHNSSLGEILVYALYGKLIRNINHKDVINNNVKKGLEVGVEFKIKDDLYKIVRKRKPDSLKFWRNDKEETLGKETQSEIEKILGMSYEVFINVACFGQHNEYNFLDCDTPTKRSIVENLLSLEKYKKFQNTAKEKKKDLERDIKNLLVQYETLISSKSKTAETVTKVRAKQSEWFETKENDIRILQKRANDKKEELLKSNDGAILIYQQAQDEIEKLISKNESLEASVKKIKSQILEINEKVGQLQTIYQEARLEIKDCELQKSSLNTKINEIEEELSSFKDNRCPKCLGELVGDRMKSLQLHHSNCKSKYGSKLIELDEKIKEQTRRSEQAIENVKKLKFVANSADDKVTQTEAIIVANREKIKNLGRIEKPNLSNREQILRQQLTEIEEQLISKQDEVKNDPYKEILETAINDLEEYEIKAKKVWDDLKHKESLFPYYNYWIRGFGDDGIRSFIIEDILPALNARINYWLQFLIDGKIKLVFDNQLNELIENNPPNGDPYVYHGLSGGQKRRLNLAISQAFAYVMMLNSGTWPSVVILDEVGADIDIESMGCLYRMITELASERQVFVITHSEKLQEMLESVDKIHMSIIDGHSKLLENKF